MTTLNFTKSFTGGTLKGLTVEETMHFESQSAAAGFVKFGRNGCENPIDGSSPWKIVSDSLTDPLDSFIEELLDIARENPIDDALIIIRDRLLKDGRRILEGNSVAKGE